MPIPDMGLVVNLFFFLLLFFVYLTFWHARPFKFMTDFC